MTIVPSGPTLDTSVDPLVTGRLPAHLAKRYQAIPMRRSANDRLVLGMVTPGDLKAVDDLRAYLGEGFERLLLTPQRFAELMREVARGSEEVLTVAGSETAENDLAQVGTLSEDAPIVRFVNNLIQQAAQDRASDIHIEPTEHDLRIRVRIDGVLHERMRQPKSIALGVASRLKVMSDIDIAERRKPQDGRMSFSVEGHPIDLRVSTLPTVHGEKIVMRILDQAGGVTQLAKLGFLPDQMERYRSSYVMPYGAILVTGPTGSGKSTTLYATLNEINDATRNIVTVEDPVEYRMPGINQVQTNNRAGLTFAAALRSILRQDPDVILVGEIRDRETGIIAIEAALTGHLVLSTLHTNDAPSTPLRLLEMGIEPFLIASALDCVVAQRLCRQLCEACRAPYFPSQADLDAMSWHPEDGAPFGMMYRAAGCSACGHTGYRGRLAIHEVMLISEEIERAIVSGGATDEIRRIALEQGMVTLRDDGMRKAMMGLTTFEEITRVIV